MRKTLIIGGIILICLLVGCNGYNGMDSLDQNVKKSWSQVENQYQRRSDLIPNLVSTVKGAANFEQQTLEGVVQARASATQMKVNIDDLSPEKIKEYQAIQGQLGAALGRLLSVSENYPDLKANKNFQDLSAELAGTENRIAVARKDFNEVVQTYNVKVKSFPNNLMAGIFGFHEKGFFEAEAGAQKAPEVKF